MLDLGDGKSVHSPPDLEAQTHYCPLLSSGTAVARRRKREEKLGLKCSPTEETTLSPIWSAIFRSL